MSYEQAIDDFIQKVNGVHVVEYGDLKRRVGHYIVRLEEILPATPSVQKKIFEMRNTLIYNCKDDIDMATAQVTEWAREMKTLV